MLRLIDMGDLRQNFSNHRIPAPAKVVPKSGILPTVRQCDSFIRYPVPTTRKSSRTADCHTDSLMYNIKSLWLFTYSDLKTIIIPSTLFAVLHLLASESLGLNPACTSLIQGTLRALLWAWINLLPFAIDNQRQPSAIKEDRINKAWRTFPSNRMSPETGRTLMLFFYSLAIVISYHLNGLLQCLSLVVLGFIYNDLGAADKSCLLRNLINGLGFVCYTSGALQVSLGSGFSWSPRLAGWLGLIGTVVCTTVQTQDMYDQPGDAERGRATVPLVIGDGRSRWSIAVPMMFWSFFCPWYWNAPLAVGGVSALFAWTVALRTLTKRSISNDKSTFLVWNVWMVSLYCLPLAASGT